MEIRDNDKICIIAPICTKIDSFKTSCILKRINRDEKEYAEAQRLLAFLKYFDPIYDDSYIPNNSIIREFIGGSVIVK